MLDGERSKQNINASFSLRVHFLELHAFSSSQPGSSFPPKPSPGASLSQEIKICVPGGPKWRGLLRSDERQKQRENSGKEVANGALALRAIWGVKAWGDLISVRSKTCRPVGIKI